MKIIALIISFSYMVALFIGSSLPYKVGSENVLSSLPSLFQNLLHIPGYGVLILLWISTFKNCKIRYPLSVILAMRIVTLYGACLELYQARGPGRYPSMMDLLLLDLSGVLLSVFMYNTSKRRNILGVFEW